MSFATLVWPAGLENEAAVPSADELMELDERIMNLDASRTSEEASLAALLAANLRGVAQFTLPAATYADDAFYAFSLVDRTPPADGYPLLVAGSAAGGGNYVQIGENDGKETGWWRVAIEVEEIDVEGLGTAVEVYLFDAAASADPTTGSKVKTIDTVVRSGGGDNVKLTGEYVFKIEAGAGTRGIAFRVDAFAGHVISGTTPTIRAHIYVHQIVREIP